MQKQIGKLLLKSDVTFNNVFSENSFSGRRMVIYVALE